MRRLVLLDIGLPGMDGYALADLIRQRYGEARPHLVVLSGYAVEATDPKGRGRIRCVPDEAAGAGAARRVLTLPIPQTRGGVGGRLIPGVQRGRGAAPVRICTRERIFQHGACH